MRGNEKEPAADAVLVKNGPDQSLFSSLVLLHAQVQRGDRGSRIPPPPEKSQSYRVSLIQYWSGSLEKSQSYQARIQRQAIICPPAKRHFNGVSLAGQLWPTFSGIWILFPLINLKKNRNNEKKNSDKTFWIRACNESMDFAKIIKFRIQILNLVVMPVSYKQFQV